MNYADKIIFRTEKNGIVNEPCVECGNDCDCSLNTFSRCLRSDCMNYPRNYCGKITVTCLGYENKKQKCCCDIDGGRF